MSVEVESSFGRLVNGTRVLDGNLYVMAFQTCLDKNTGRGCLCEKVRLH